MPNTTPHLPMLKKFRLQAEQQLQWQTAKEILSKRGVTSGHWQECPPPPQFSAGLLASAWTDR